MNFHMLINAFINAGLPEKDAWDAAYDYRETIELLGDVPVEKATQEDYDEGVRTEISYWEC